MNAQATPQGYSLDLSPAEREALIAGLEIAVGLARGESVVSLRCLLADAAVDRLDAITDSVFLAGVPS